jgi:endonuclease/exonuclease/phosphatase family metal-dependent hydrolase
MPFYQTIKEDTLEGKRIIDNLLALRRQLDRDIPPRTLDETLLLATWNIREFDSPAYGERIPEALHYIAEIIARFDLVAVQEVRRSLKALDKVNNLLGSHWDYIVTDVTEGAPGNQERMAFLYDTRKIKFGGLASDVVLPPIRKKDANNKTVYEPVLQLARSPFMAGFRAGWTKFMLVTVHILYGTSAADDPERVDEIRKIARYLNERSMDDTSWANNIVLLGDFNIFEPDDETVKALLEGGFTLHQNLMRSPTNAGRSKHFDQIAFRVRPERFATTANAGVFNYYETVFRDEDEETYATYMGEAYEKNSKGAPRDKKGKASYYKTYWRTHQMSDHLPMWVELRIDYSDEYLEHKREGEA